MAVSFIFLYSLKQCYSKCGWSLVCELFVASPQQDKYIKWEYVFIIFSRNVTDITVQFKCMLTVLMLLSKAQVRLAVAELAGMSCIWRELYTCPGQEQTKTKNWCFPTDSLRNICSKSGVGRLWPVSQILHAIHLFLCIKFYWNEPDPFIFLLSMLLSPYRGRVEQLQQRPRGLQRVTNFLSDPLE